jgi:light-regulated signal transduction histidine kinase (bacteriophytochrome)
MGALIEDLLTLSRLGRSEVNKQDVDMKDMVTELFNELKPGPPSREIEFTLKDIPNAQVDPSLFRHVWTNLLSNAIKFSREKDHPKIEVGSNVQDGYLVYYVKDNGAGFSMDYANKLFKVFTRLHTAEEYEGTGIGLAIVHQIVARHGGKVWADAKVGEGATFYVGLPLRDETS